MANLYMGRGGLDGLFGTSQGAVGDVPLIPTNPPRRPANTNIGAVGNVARIPGGPPPPGMPPVSAPSDGSVLGAQTIRPTGPSQGYDPGYLQNLATSIGALFARPQGNLSFNPLGNLSEVSPASGIGGTAPGLGAPLTWLQQALNGLGFSFGSPATAPPVTSGKSVGDNGGADTGGKRGGIYSTL
jgi:hypothetical protein